MNSKTTTTIIGLVVFVAVFLISTAMLNTVFAKEDGVKTQNSESGDDGVVVLNDSAPNNDTCTVSKKDCVILDNAMDGIADIVKNFNSAYPGMK